MYTNSHCSSLEIASVVMRTPASLISVLDNAIQNFNFLKTPPLNSRQFKVFCNDTDGEYHTEYCWWLVVRFWWQSFNWGRNCSFVSETKTPLSNPFPHVPWLQQPPYFADTFSKLNEDLLSMQGHNIVVFTAEDKVEAVSLKFVSW